ncbi:MAG: hypothetical protein CVV03_12770 [Firmicutes bacterium HGW-Firmicutes-8]|nr:MAG: hypothetical protein CVV03_12770 [Firmicutes bacterium HGW-Firmicutes-8]
MRIRLFKLNNSFRPIVLTYPTAQRYDFTATGISGEVWRWSSGKVFAPLVQPGFPPTHNEVGGVTFKPL